MIKGNDVTFEWGNKIKKQCTYVLTYLNTVVIVHKTFFFIGQLKSSFEKIKQSYNFFLNFFTAIKKKKIITSAFPVIINMFRSENKILHFVAFCFL